MNPLSEMDLEQVVAGKQQGSKMAALKSNQAALKSKQAATPARDIGCGQSASATPARDLGCGQQLSASRDLGGC